MASLFRSSASASPLLLRAAPTKTPPPPLLCQRCTRSFVSSALLRSGHNKWSKIKHDKAANDAKRNTLRSQFNKAISLYTKLYGPNPDENPQLASSIAAAKKAGVPKANIETAIARGQGKTSAGAALESLTFEAVVPPSVALIVDVETESKLRALQDLNFMVKRARGASSASKFFFSRVGRVVFEAGTGKGIGDGEGKDSVLGVDEIMDDAIEAGAEDLEADEEGNIVIWTQPNQTMQICQTIASKFGLKILSSDIVWSPNEETVVRMDSGHELKTFTELLVALKEYPEVQAVYSNVAKGAASDEEWALIEENLDV